jgi:hypothetical protein
MSMQRDVPGAQDVPVISQQAHRQVRRKAPPERIASPECGNEKKASESPPLLALPMESNAIPSLAKPLGVHGGRIAHNGELLPEESCDGSNNI